MGARLFLFIIFFFTSYGYTCEMCHKPHYEDMGSCVSCHRGNMDSSRKNIAHDGILTSKYSSFYTDKDNVERGEQIVEKSACRRCHVIAGQGEKAAVSLDVRAKSYDGEYLADKIKNTNEYMPDFHFSDADITSIVNYMLYSSSLSAQQRSEPFVAYIRQQGEDVFTRHCGNCHKIITRQSGGRGTGEIGRNLSGLSSKYFESDILKDGERWTKESLLKWVKNPRSIKKTAIMPPLRLNEKEEEELIQACAIEYIE